MPFDQNGTHIVVFKAGDVWVPGTDVEAAKICNTVPTVFVATHTAISVLTSVEQIEQIGQREEWRVLTQWMLEGRSPFDLLYYDGAHVKWKSTNLSIVAMS